MTPTGADERLVGEDAARSPRYTVQAAARRVGVPTATLRSWNQRYGIGPVQRDAGRHRLYSEADLAVVRHMRSLMTEGASTRAAAKAALGTTVPPLDSVAVVLDAALDLDATVVGEFVDRHVRHYGTVDTWERLIRPVFAAIETRQSNGEGCIDVEHVLSWTVARCLQRVSATAPTASASVILACTGTETHTLVLEVLRSALCERNQATLMLGSATPLDAMLDALRRRSLRTTVVLFSQTPDTADIETVQAILAVGARLLIAGAGWATVAVPAETTWVNTLDEALRCLPVA